ncbi:hypothetical protein AG1IA_05844 [Rhizoctonia solani AG-1 IA]|uniref:Amino acid permease domain-containing protein n=1 Tax=Thanatephorus cucumeris (strain AG1-IA) TaxID=983506 RepID=L8WPP7_THACA|nr:hypothetical protein AG1IA_05844 [Rhizoctonia solani AG-1 IA]
MTLYRSNAAVAVPWAIIGAIGISGILGTAMNIAIAFCMGTDLEAIIDSDIGQPLAAVSISYSRDLVRGRAYSMGYGLQHCPRDFTAGFCLLARRSNAILGILVSRLVLGIHFGAVGPSGFRRRSSYRGCICLNTLQYSIPIGARFLFKGHNYKPGPFNLGVFGLPVAIVAIVFMTFISVVFLFPTELAPAVADMNYAVVVMGGVMIGCLIWYWFPKYGGVNWFEGPVTTVEALPKSIPSEDNGSIEREKEKIGENAIQ